jgi:hypothetical protein
MRLVETVYDSYSSLTVQIAMYVACHVSPRTEVTIVVPDWFLSDSGFSFPIYGGRMLTFLSSLESLESRYSRNSYSG